MRRLILPAAAALGLLAGCAATAVAVAGIAVTQEFIDNANSAYVNASAAESWVATKNILNSLSLDTATFDEENMAARANIDGAIVTALVELRDTNRSKIVLGAKKWGVYQPIIAEEVLNLIRKELD